MENPNLSLSNCICPSEESGWTSYFDEFLASEKKKTNLCDSSSLVSDASWKPQLSSPPLKSCKDFKLIKKMMKKKKTRIDFEDDALEDTATSPVNSPKEKVDEDGQGKEVDKRRIEEMSNAGRVTEIWSQRKKGLCLGPFSMFINNI